VNDVSLIKVDAPFEFNDNVKAIPLPPQGFDPEGKKLFKTFNVTIDLRTNEMTENEI